MIGVKHPFAAHSSRFSMYSIPYAQSYSSHIMTDQLIRTTLLSFPVETIFTILEAGYYIYDLTQVPLTVSLVNRSWSPPVPMLLFPSRHVIRFQGAFTALRNEILPRGKNTVREVRSLNLTLNPEQPRLAVFSPSSLPLQFRCFNFQVPAMPDLTCHSRSKSTLTQ